MMIGLVLGWSSEACVSYDDTGHSENNSKMCCEKNKNSTLSFTVGTGDVEWIDASVL